MEVKKPVQHRKPGRPKKEVAKHPEEKLKHVVKHHVVKPVEEKPEVLETLETEVKPIVAKIPHGKTLYAVGRRKTSVAQVLLSEGTGTITVNLLPLENYFSTMDLQTIVLSPLRSLGLEKGVNIRVKVHGGGIHSQAESVRHAISRSLLQFNPESRKVLKKQGFLRRDPRVKERKKPGLKRARRAPQFSKR
jgi:small subunit ribosomal protein S9